MALTVADGRDTHCLDSLVPGRLVKGKTLVAQRLYRRLTTPPGTLRGSEEERDFGVDLPGFVGSIEPTSTAAVLPVRVQNELLKDPAVESVEVVANRVEDAGSVSWELTIDVVTSAGEVSLILAVSDVTVDLLGVR